ncbi:MAG: PHP domain-containing protein [Gemmatimonadota bacterium]
MDRSRNRIPVLSSAEPGVERFVDLHTHSTASDGEKSPTEVARAAARAGLFAIALTDHDTIDGLPELIAAGDTLDLKVIPGCEFSVSAPWGEMHLLGYFLPPDSVPLNEFLVVARAGRSERGRKMVEQLQAIGVNVKFEDLLAESDGAAIGRPHLARALLKAGVAKSVNDAFDRYLGRGRPGYVDKELPTLRQVADLVHSVGGVVSAAHLKDRGSKSVLRRFKDEGLDAVETRHPSHDADRRSRLTELALATGLLRTGGSDWHGDDAGMGTHAPLGSQEVPLDWLDRLEAARPAPSRPATTP